jgi:hypothetical protein
MERKRVAVRVALYARCSTHDKGQDPELQLAPLREYCQKRGFTIAGVPGQPPEESGDRAGYGFSLSEGEPSSCRHDSKARSAEVNEQSGTGSFRLRDSLSEIIRSFLAAPARGNFSGLSRNETVDPSSTRGALS